jgi:uncharacterized membrane protein
VSRAPASATAPAASDPPPVGVEAVIVRQLTFGSRLATSLLVVGSVLLVLEGTSPLAGDWPQLDPGRLAADILGLRPAGFLWLGLLVTIVTPLLRVGIAIIGFGRAGEWPFAALGAAVLGVVALAVVAGAIGV